MMDNKLILEDAIDEFFLARDTGALDGGWIQAENMDLIAKNLYESQGKYTVDIARPESREGRKELKRKDKSIRTLLKQVKNASSWEDSMPSLDALAASGMNYSFNISEHRQIDKGYNLLTAINNTSNDRSKHVVGKLNPSQKNIVLDTEHTAKLLSMIYNNKASKQKTPVLQRVKKYAAAVATGALTAIALGGLFGGNKALPADYVDCPPVQVKQIAPADKVPEPVAVNTNTVYKKITTHNAHSIANDDLSRDPKLPDKHRCYASDTETIKLKGDSLGAFSRRYLDCLDKSPTDEHVTYFAKRLAENNNKDIDAWIGRPCDNNNSWHCIDQGEEITDIHSAVTNFIEKYETKTMVIAKRG